MIAFLIILVIFNKFYIQNTGMNFLNRLLEIDIFALFFICLCFLFIINGSNLIDGYNGLLSIHTLIILINLVFINYFRGNSDLAFLIFSAILIIIIFLKHNFPNAAVFLGDSGSYFLGAFTAISIIKTSILNPSISPFYFCILLFYLFFEVFFSFIRKIAVEKRSPLFPDRKHLHMLIYKYFLKKNNDKLKSNYYVSIILNLVYLILILPAFFMMEDGLFCKYYSLVLFIAYLLSYKIIYEKTK
jgi:UDP-N-acetylmuramyl pentapeptide phosphotransferase/UDP-N-acetylglucosamine-1-phosphate transferase